ncbi:amino acid permease [Butyrivibrio sp. JL13D10]|uniref:amino acid permease n=1 Tax=Butyrivibrio sp. JL13D10 TaxID=3236815 RepID=UPI0038B5DE21
MGKKNNLKSGPGFSKSLSQLNVWALSFGCAVGWGAFMMPGTTFLPLAGPIGTVLGVLFGGLIMLVIGFNYSFMINHYPDAGGSFTFARENIGYDHGFLCSWFLALVYISIAWANATALPLIFRHLFGNIFQIGFHYQIAGYDVYFGEAMLSVFAIVCTGVFIYLGSKVPAIIQTVSAMVLLLGVIVIFTAAILHIVITGVSIKPSFAEDNHPLLGITSIIALAPWAFVGFESISHATEEFRFSPGKVFKIIVFAIFSATFCYAALAIIATSSIPEGYSDWSSYIFDLDCLEGYESVPTFYATFRLLGTPGIIMLCLAILGAVISGILGNSYALSRLMLSMSRLKMLPAWFGHSDKKHLPPNIVPFIVILSLPIPFLGRSVIGWIVDVSTIGASIAYMYTSLVAYKVAKNENNRLIKVTGALGIFFSAFFFLYFLLPIFTSVARFSTESYLILVIWSVLGFLFFRYVYHNDKDWKFGNSTVVWTMLLFLIFFTTTLWTRQLTHQTTNNVIANLIDYHTEEFHNKGLEFESHDEAELDTFLNEQMTEVNLSLMINSTVEIILIIIALTILLNLHSAIIQRQKNAAEELVKSKNSFLANMSHEIRTPINTILGLNEMILRESKEENCKKYANSIQVAGNMLVSLVDEVLDYSQIDSGKLEITNSEYQLADILNDVTINISSRAKAKGLIYVENIDTGIPNHLYGDKVRLRQILLNLLSNAVKYTERGKVSLTINYSKQDEANILLTCSVCDTGVGIQEQDKKKLFDTFERLDGGRSITAQGTGLGLNIVKELLELMGGSLELESVVGLGSNFTFKLSQKVLDWTPISDVPQTPGDESKGKSGYTPKFLAPNAKILLVDDTEMNLLVFKNLLKETKLNIDTAMDGKEGLSLTAHTEYDLLVIDHRMPIMDGVQMLTALRHSPDNPNHNKPCICLTANAGEGAREKYLKLGFDDYMAKPVSGIALEKMIMTHMPKEKIEKK